MLVIYKTLAQASWIIMDTSLWLLAAALSVGRQRQGQYFTVIIDPCSNRSCTTSGSLNQNYRRKNVSSWCWESRRIIIYIVLIIRNKLNITIQITKKYLDSIRLFYIFPYILLNTLTLLLPILSFILTLIPIFDYRDLKVINLSCCFFYNWRIEASSDNELVTISWHWKKLSESYKE